MKNYIMERPWLRELRPDTAEGCFTCVGYLENLFLDEPDTEPMTLERAIDYCYTYFVEDMGSMWGRNRAQMFDGKDKILNAIKMEILTDECILLSDAEHIKEWR